MNGYLITVFCCSCIIIACVIIYNNVYYEALDTAIIITITTAIVVGSVCGLLSIIFPIKAKKELAEFNARKEYIETYYEKDSNVIENYGINNEVIELNLWLFNAKASQESFGTWSAYYDIDLSNVEPIALR